ncbi:hypothetical protein [Legionella sp.]|uniref:hypothetical protein n=1 Tax=Legionella sp. TaxID=459 RepID=UPI0032202894
MKNYSSVRLRFWSDPDTQALSDQAKLLALYLLTGSHSNLLGCFRLPRDFIAEDLLWDFEIASQRFIELFQNGFIAHDQSSDWIFIPRFLEWIPIENSNQAKSLRKLFEQIPEKSIFYKKLIDILLGQSNHFEETFRSQLERFATRFRNQDQRIGNMELQNNGFEHSETYEQAKKVNLLGTSELIEAVDNDRLTFSTAAVLATFSPPQQREILSWPDKEITAFVNHLRHLHHSSKNSHKRIL